MAAGQGFKTFITGEVLTAGDVNGYLMQGINVFANSTARDAAITAPAEGQFAFTKDNNSLWYYDGAAWVASGATGDIEGVTAGVGISGGGTSGTVTITNSMATAIDAKGDLVPGTGADTFSRLAVGSNGTVLTADSAEATGLKWATPASGSMTLLETITFNGAASYTSATISGSYKNLYMVITNFKPATDNRGLNMRVNGITSTSYTHITGYLSTSSFNQSSAEISANLDDTVVSGIATIQIADYANATTIKVIEAKSIGFNATTSTDITWRYSFSPVNTTNAITSVTIFASSGNVTSGTVLIYGVN